MRWFAFALLAFLAIYSAQTEVRDQSDLVVIKFSCGEYETGSGVIRPVHEPDPPRNEPFTINQTQKNEPQEITNRRDILERRTDLRRAEVNATLSGKKNAKVYFYRLEVKNSGAKPIKSFAWEYQPPDESDPSNRQFFCAVKAKPDETKKLELFSPLAPSRVIDANKAADKSSPAGKTVINKIEYSDGTVWLRSGWNPQTFSEDSVQKVASGRCIGL